MIAGRLRPTMGRIVFRDQELVGLKASRINKLGIARTFQDTRLLPEMSVLENVMMAGHGRIESAFWAPVLGLPGYAREERALRQEALGLLDRMGLEHLAAEAGGALAYGQQRRLEIARAMATRPRLLLLDEPAAGMNPNETIELMSLISRLKAEFNLTVLLIEHDMKFVMGLCERIVVLDHGLTIAQGAPAEIQRDPRVIAAYLGEKRSAGH
jgi:branched-chain amino acid transport system ATP-binding protein